MLLSYCRYASIANVEHVSAKYHDIDKYCTVQYVSDGALQLLTRLGSSSISPNGDFSMFAG